MKRPGRASRARHTWRLAWRPARLWLALVLVVQWAPAYGHCCHAVRAAAMVAAVTDEAICTAHQEAPAPVPSDAAVFANPGCAACHLVAASEPSPPLVPAVRVLWHAAPVPLSRAGLPDAGPRAPAPPARGPPSA